jgi:peptidoglycan/LPS O-acetylase OafA/YrhL
MDALRASTMLLLVPVHSALLLSVNGHGGTWAMAFYWAVHVFRLPLFFAMSGFFLVLLLSRKGLRATARNRTIRIVGPLAIGLVTLVPLLILASRATGIAIGEEAPAVDGSPFVFEPSFLWFLWYLLIIDAAAVSIFLLAPGLLGRAGRGMRTLLSRPITGIALLVVPTTLALWPADHWIVDPRPGTFVPDPAALAYYALFFGLGATLSAHRGLVAEAGRNAWTWAACAVLAAVPAGLLFALRNSADLGSRPEIHLAALLIYAIATWASLLALVGLANRYLSQPRPALRYMADSSYWIYLSHLPAMVLVIALVGSTALGTGPQFVLITLGSLAFSLATYPLFVRYTPIGRLLNGPRQRPARTSPTRPAAAAAPRA